MPDDVFYFVVIWHQVLDGQKCSLLKTGCTETKYEHFNERTGKRRREISMYPFQFYYVHM